MRVKRLSWIMTLGLTGAVIGLIAAPQALFAGVALIDVLPRWLIGPPANATVALLSLYDGVLLGTGLGLWLIGQRLGWASGHVSAGVITLCPMVAEIFVLRATALAAPLSTAGVVIRLVVVATALGLAMISVRAPETDP